MKYKLLSLFFTVLSLAFSFSVSSQILNDSLVSLIPHWKKGENHSIKIKNTAISTVNGKSKTFVSLFDARFEIIEVSANGYVVEWEYTQSNLNGNDPEVENHIIDKLLGVKILFKLSEGGRFVELLNVEDIRAKADKIIDELIVKNINKASPMNALYKIAKQLITSKQGLEIALLKPIKMCNFFWGDILKLNYLYTAKTKLANPLGGQLNDAVENVKMTKLDYTDSTCVIENNKVTDATNLKNSVINSIEKLSSVNSQKDKEIRNEDVEISESTMQQINFSKCIIRKSFYKRDLKWASHNRSKIMEIETVE